MFASAFYLSFWRPQAAMRMMFGASFKDCAGDFLGLRHSLLARPQLAVAWGGGGDGLAAFPSRLRKACDMEPPSQNQAQLQGMHFTNEPIPQKQE
jgi:hypothetical protein